MANIIRIRKLKKESDLRNVLIPVDKNTYTSDCKYITILDLKTFILSGYTGTETYSHSGQPNYSVGGILRENFLSGFTNVPIKHMFDWMLYPTTTTTTTPVPTTTTTTLPPTTTTTTLPLTTTTTLPPTTTTTTLPPTTTTTTTSLTQIYFNSILGDLNISNPIGQTLSITFAYSVEASCDNIGTSGSDSVGAISTLEITTDGGMGWTTIDTISASVSGGNYPNPQSDSQSISGTYTVNGITNVTNVKVGDTKECACSLDCQSGSITVTIVSVTPDFGSCSIGCNNQIIDSCTGTFLNCV